MERSPPNIELKCDLFLSTDEVPAEELELTSAEGTDEFVVPLPPEDHELDVVEEESRDGDRAEGTDREKAKDGDAPNSTSSARAPQAACWQTVCLKIQVSPSCC